MNAPDDPRVGRAREAIAIDYDAYDELVDTDPLKLRDLALSHHAVIDELLAYIDERGARP